MIPMNETKTNAQSDARYPDAKDAYPSHLTADRVARLVTELGAGWARLGLTFGRLALAQSAKALETTSDLLGALAQKVDELAKPEEAKTDEAKTEVVAQASSADGEVKS